MTILQNLGYNTPVTLDEYVNKEGFLQRIYLEKSFFPALQKDQYFISIAKINYNKNQEKIGYIYFYFNQYEKSCEFIGMFIKTEFRNQGLSSLLTSYWIRLCLDLGIVDLYTTKKQRKPFLIYILKTYFFELNNITIYQDSINNIHICRKEKDDKKYLLFDNDKEKASFQKGTIYTNDNYQILDELEGDTEKLDTVILSKRYFLKDDEAAYKKALRIKKNQQG